MEKVTTAKELLNKRVYITKDGIEDVHDSVSAVATAMIDFAKMHVEAALKEASKNATVTLGEDWVRKQEEIHPNQLISSITVKVGEDSILNSYPLSNIV